MTPLRKILTYKEYRAVTGVFRTFDPAPPLHPASVSSPRKNSSEDARHWIGLLQYNLSTLHSQSRQTDYQGFSPVVRIGTPPLTHRRVCPPSLVRGGGTQSLAGEGAGGVPIRTRGQTLSFVLAVTTLHGF